MSEVEVAQASIPQFEKERIQKDMKLGSVQVELDREQSRTKEMKTEYDLQIELAWKEIAEKLRFISNLEAQYHQLKAEAAANAELGENKCVLLENSVKNNCRGFEERIAKLTKDLGECQQALQTKTLQSNHMQNKLKEIQQVFQKKIVVLTNQVTNMEQELSLKTYNETNMKNNINQNLLKMKESQELYMYKISILNEQLQSTG